MKFRRVEHSGKNSYGEYGQQVDNSYSTIQKLSMLYFDSEFSDLQLYVGDKVFYTHKLILSISSDVFKTMLTSPKWPESLKDQISLQEEPECVEVFGDFLHYLYSGRIHMSHVTVLPILSLADKYNIGDLSILCIDYMCKHLVAPRDTSHVLSWYKYATMCSHRQLECVCEEYILWNFQYIMETDDFLTASQDIIFHFIESPEIVIKHEYLLYLSIKKWIAAKKCPHSSTRSRVNSPNNCTERQVNSPHSCTERQGNSPHNCIGTRVNSPHSCTERQGNSPHNCIGTQGNSQNASYVKSSHESLEIQNFLKTVVSNIRFHLMTCKELKTIREDSLYLQYRNILEAPISSALDARAKHQTRNPLNPSACLKEISSCSIKDCTKNVASHPVTVEAQHVHDSSKNSPNEESFRVSKLEESSSNLDLFDSQILSTSFMQNPNNISILDVTSSPKVPNNCSRIYTCDSWCTEVLVPDIDNVTPGSVLGAFFSTPMTGLEEDDSFFWDWHLDFYPKGVAFKKCMMIGIQENKVIDEVLYERVRLTVTSNIKEKRRVRISVLVCGLHNGMEYVVGGTTKLCIFDEDHVLYNINDIIPYSELHNKQSVNRIGDDRNQVKLIVVIRPAAS